MSGQYMQRSPTVQHSLGWPSPCLHLMCSDSQVICHAQSGCVTCLPGPKTEDLAVGAAQAAEGNKMMGCNEEHAVVLAIVPESSKDYKLDHD